MIIVYRPELENPPMDKECTISFSFMDGSGNPEVVQLTSGVTRGFSEATWKRIKGYDVTKNLLSTGALRIEEEGAATPEGDEGGATVLAPKATDSLADLAIPTAMSLIEDSFDTAQLNQWLAKEQRVKVRNSIAKRLHALEAGEG
jgi:hypothetical protein